ncbi:MAG: VanZ family protein [Bacteroidota bacterium]
MTRYHALAALWTAIVLAGCLVPGDAIRDFALFSRDKLYHIAAFAIYAVLWRRAGWSLKAVVGSGIAFALLIEILQGTLPIGRYADPLDTLADIVGLGLGVWIWRTFRLAREERKQRTGA